MRSSFSWFIREKIGHVSVLLPKIHFITIIFLPYPLAHLYLYRMVIVLFSNSLRLEEFKTVSHVYIMGLPHLLKVR